MDKLEIGSLVNKLNRYTEAYDAGQPLISDEEWDNLYFKLLRAEQETGIVLDNSPTKKVHFQTISALKKIKHNHIMASLAKTKEINDITTFVGNHKFFMMAKMDGLTCSLTYNADGDLVRAETRGNGTIGEDITHNVIGIPSIPKHINSNKEFIIDGEMICTYPDFEDFKDKYANPRNFAAGSIRLLNAKECATRKLTFVAWDVIKGLDDINTLSERLYQLGNTFGFITVPRVLNCNIDNIEQNIQSIKTLCEDIYPIDGVVIKFDNCDEYNNAGNTEHHPKGALSFKFYDEEYATELLNITYDVSRRGILTPVAIFTPINIDDTVVSKASLHNLSVMHEVLGLYPKYKQKIWVSKMNMIIPQIVRAEKNDIPHDHIIQEQTCCPICGGPLEVRRDGIADILYCTNPNCSRKIINQLDFALGKKALDIKGLSKATLEKLIDWNWVNSFSDIFELKDHRSEWARKTGFGIKSVDKILNSIAVGSHTTLDKVIAACMIPNIGATASKDLAKYFKTWDNFRKSITDNFDFTSLPNMGSVADYDIKHHDYSEMDMIVNKYLTIEKESKEVTDNNTILNDKIFVITGKLSVTRDKLKAELEGAGAKVTGSVSTKTDYLIANAPENTTKYKKAKTLNIPIISEAQVRIMLQS